MELPDQEDSQDLSAIGAQEDGSSDFPFPDSLLLLHQRYGVVMNGVGDLVTERASELVRISYEIQKRIDHIHVAARSCECIRLLFMNQIELERMIVAGLGCPSDGIG